VTGVKKLIKTILSENGTYSLTRIASAVLLLAFLIGSFWLIFHGQTWGNYDSFATICGGGGATSQVVNKFINSKYNTPQGGAGKPEGRNLNG
jgi:hypothetical protein